MREQLLKLIKELELLHATAIIDFDTTAVNHLQYALSELYYAYKALMDYE